MIHRYDGLAQHEHMEEAYYVSDDWRKGPRRAMLALIENYTDIVFEVGEDTLEGFRGRAQVGGLLTYSLNNPFCAATATAAARESTLNF